MSAHPAGAPRRTRARRAARRRLSLSLSLPSAGALLTRAVRALRASRAQFRAGLQAWLVAALEGDARACALDAVGSDGAASLANQLAAVPDAFDSRVAPADILAAGSEVGPWEPDAIADALARLTPDNCVIFHTSPKFSKKKHELTVTMPLEACLRVPLS